MKNNMKNLSQLLLLTIFLIISSCDYVQNTDKQIVDNKTKKLKSKFEGYTVSHKWPLSIKIVYITDENGVELKQYPNLSSIQLDTLYYGEKVDVIEEKENWFGIRRRITRNIIEYNNVIETTRWEKVYIPKNKTGTLAQIKITNNNVKNIVSLNHNGHNEVYEKPFNIDKFIDIEVISEAVFRQKKDSIISFVDNSLVDVILKDSIIELQCNDTIVKYVSEPNKWEKPFTYNYIGEIKHLNKYILKLDGYEGYEYKFVDKEIGAITDTFSEFPQLSIDKKYLVIIYPNPYSQTGELTLYSISQGETVFVMQTNFKSWMPARENQELFWNKDGCLYLNVLPAMAFWNEYRELNDKYQYIKISIL